MERNLIKCVSMLLITLLILGLFMGIFSVKEVQAKAQNTKDYKKGSNMLDKYPGYSIQCTPDTAC